MKELMSNFHKEMHCDCMKVISRHLEYMVANSITAPES